MLIIFCGIGRKQHECVTCVQTTAESVFLLHTVHKVFGIWINHRSVLHCSSDQLQFEDTNGKKPLKSD